MRIENTTNERQTLLAACHLYVDNVCVLSVNLSLSLALLRKQVLFALIPKHNVDVYNTMLPPFGYNGHALSSPNVVKSSGTCRLLADKLTICTSSHKQSNKSIMSVYIWSKKVDNHCSRCPAFHLPLSLYALMPAQTRSLKSAPICFTSVDTLDHRIVQIMNLNGKNGVTNAHDWTHS